MKTSYIIKLESNNYKGIKNFINFIKKEKINLIPLPKKQKQITFIKGPHVNSKSKDKYQIKEYRILFKCFKKEVIRFLLKNLPINIQIKIKKIDI